MDFKEFKHVPGLVIHTKTGDSEVDLKSLEDFVGSGKAYAKTTAGDTFIALDCDTISVAEKNTWISLSENLLVDNILFEHLPRCHLTRRDNETVREVLGIFGESGSGKSTYADKYAALFLKMNPKSRVYIISEIHDGYNRVTAVNPKAVSRIRVTPGHIPGHDEALTTDQIVEKLKKIRGRDFANCLIIFDDIEQSLGSIKTEIYRLRDELLTTGRHNHVFMCIIEHLMFKYHLSRTLLTECTSFTLFPGSGDYQIRQYFSTRLSIKESDPLMARIFENHLPTYNWVTIFPQIPKKVLKPTETWLLHPSFSERYSFYNQIRPYVKEMDNDLWVKTARNREALIKKRQANPLTTPFVLDYVTDDVTSDEKKKPTHTKRAARDITQEILDEDSLRYSDPIPDTETEPGTLEYHLMDMQRQKYQKKRLKLS